MFGLGNKRKKTKLGEAQVLEALKQVRDPDLNRDIVSLGFVKNLQIKGDRVAFDVELTTPACPVKEQLKQQCEAVVQALGAARVDVNMTARVRGVPGAGKRNIPGVRNVLAVASGKGGVGKSTVAVNLAMALAKSGARAGLMDCDIYGPSLPTLLNLHDKPRVTPDQRIVPLEAYGLPVMSMGFLVEVDRAVVWRGPMLHKMIQQFLFQVAWGELDYLVLDLPPGTGDVQLSLAQQTPVSAGLVVTTPQEIALMDARKGVEMFRTVGIPVLGFVENMSYYLCRRCEKRHQLFGKAGGGSLAREYQLPLLAELPFDVNLAAPGPPLLIRESKGALPEAFMALAGNVAAELSKIGAAQWTVPGPGAFEV